MRDVSYEVQTLFFQGKPDWEYGIPFSLYFESHDDANEYMNAVAEHPHSLTTLIIHKDLLSIEQRRHWVPEASTDA